MRLVYQLNQSWLIQRDRRASRGTWMCLKSWGDWSKPCEITVMSHSSSMAVAKETAKLSAPPPIFEKLRVKIASLVFILLPSS